MHCSENTSLNSSSKLTSTHTDPHSLPPDHESPLKHTHTHTHTHTDPHSLPPDHESPLKHTHTHSVETSTVNTLILYSDHCKYGECFSASHRQTESAASEAEGVEGCSCGLLLLGPDPLLCTHPGSVSFSVTHFLPHRSRGKAILGSCSFRTELYSHHSENTRLLFLAAMQNDDLKVHKLSLFLRQ